MKKFLTFLLVLAAFSSTAQIVNIPDPVFKNYLLNFQPAIDVNFDNEIQESEAAAVNFLYLNSLSITNATGIRAFTNLHDLTLSNLQLLTSLDLHDLTSLKMLRITQMESVTSINISGINNLDQLTISQMPLATVINTTGVSAKIFDINQVAVTSLDMSSFTALINLAINQTQITSLNLTNSTAITILTINQTQITSLNLTNSTALVNVSMIYNSLLTSLNVSGITTLKMLSCSNNNLSTLNITGATGITNLDCSANHLTALDLSGLNSVTNISCGNNNITSLDVHDLPNLGFIHCSDNHLTSLTFSNCPLLHDIVCGNENYYTGLDLSNGLPSLHALSCVNIPSLTSINLANCPNLYDLACQGTSLTSLDVSGKQFLAGLSCFNTPLANLNLSGCTSLGGLTINDNQLTTLDCSSCTSLTNLFINNNSQLTYLNIKNGSALQLANNIFNATGNTTLQYVCADDNEVSSIQGYFVQNGMPNVNVNSYCSFTPGGSFNTISGTVTLDLDNNGCGGTDPVIPDMMIKISDGINTGYASNNNSGLYKFYTNSGNFTVTAQSQNPYFTITPASASVGFASAGGGSQTANFCFAANGVHPDVDITMIPISRARPGFNATYKLIYTNKGTQVTFGNAELVYPNNKMTFISSTPVTTTQGTGSLNWSYTNLLPFESRSIDIEFNLLPPPTNNINDSLSLVTTINPLSGDETELDNIFDLRQVITGSFDPNDKACLEGATFDVTRVGDYAHYMIRFQNMGNDVAENIVVKDMLENNFNLNSLQLTGSSHPCIVKQTQGNKVEFIFEGINLPAVTVDEPGSHGYIAFKIKTKGALVLGDSLKNTAAIYFDYNLPVITNLAGSVVGELGTIPISMEYFKGNSQSGKHYLNWKANCTSIQARFDIERSSTGSSYSSLGNIIATNTRCLQPFDFIDNTPLAGMNYYRIKMTDVDGKITYSNIIALLNKNKGFEIVNLVPNPVVNGTGTLNITSAEKQSIHIMVTDASGKTIRSMDQNIIAGFTQVNMNFSNLAAGVYTITLYSDDNERRTTRFVKQ